MTAPTRTRRRVATCSNCGHPVALHRCAHVIPCCPGRCDLGPHAQRTRAIIACERLSLTRLERQELAELLTGHEGSWSSISEDDARRVADAVLAFHAVQALLLLRRPGWTP